jgi:single-stranded-DNA-specific exonuclease
MLSVTDKLWKERSLPAGISLQDCQDLANRLQLPLPILLLLAKRGIIEPDAINDFLSPSLQSLPSPFAMKGMDRAVAILADAIKRKAPIIIYGDYDGDGITATALMYLFLTSIGGKVSYYIPDRFDEGYGLHHKALQSILSEHADRKAVLLTVDCGISNHAEVMTARHYNCRIIITDHHTVPPVIPEADAVLNPKQTDCPFPFKQLAGVGVAFYLVMGLRTFLNEQNFWSGSTMPNLKSYLDLVALGTIADLVPLQGINRILTKAGLEVINGRRRVGVEALCRSGMESSSPRSEISVNDIAYKIMPRINAMGRMSRADKAVHLLVTDNVATASSLVVELDRVNDQRKYVQSQLFEETDRLAGELVRNNKNSLVLAGRSWHLGVLGIIASQLAAKYHRPAILLSVMDGKIKGSGRGIEGLNLYEALKACEEFLEQYGGHANAAGLSVNYENIEPFRQKFETIVREMLNQQDPTIRLLYDSITSVDDVFDHNFLHYFKKIEPFGNGNPEPVFVLNEQEFDSARIVGGNHVKFTVKGNVMKKEGIGFGFGFLLAEMKKSQRFSLACNLQYNQFRGKEQWELQLVDASVYQA